ncbi:hypothetical protein E4631_23330 [Hymenobacter sp. UV11]|uniref:hypothetical protein n=1 Tax=Hymenobacter sp. UV11 TaxID=1849735 RepID=UPI00105FC0C2|nr:hypothetical protein [Hymenobacter sp. UV11]TDN39839.1 hypothetical protein A8B98_16745 [Hymenobacter sp. UV11]TFZ63239.1 hypothetical protein E4631_23330 [Hymenobacter sp. UV11]
MPVTIPAADTPARQALLDQGSNLYPGVDQWHHPKHDLPVGTLLVQFDFRPEGDIRKGEETISPYFTDAATLLKHLSPTGEVKARNLAEALQVRPFRPTDTGEHFYSPRVSIYQVMRPIKAADVQVAQPAEFGHGRTRNNLQYGDGVGNQYFLTEAKDTILKGATPALKVADVMPCIQREHRLAWLQKLEHGQADNRAVEAAIKPLFQDRVNEMLRGTPGEQKHGREIAELYQANQQLKMLHPNIPGAKLPPLGPAKGPSPAPTPRRRGPHF